MHGHIRVRTDATHTYVPLLSNAYVYLCICVWLSEYARLLMFASVRTHLCICAFMCACMFTCVCAFLIIFVCFCVPMAISVPGCVYLYLCTCGHICISLLVFMCLCNLHAFMFIYVRPHVVEGICVRPSIRAYPSAFVVLVHWQCARVFCTCASARAYAYPDISAYAYI